MPKTQYSIPKKIHTFDEFDKILFSSLLHDEDTYLVTIKSYASLEIYYRIKFEADSIYGYRCFDEGQLEEYFAAYESRIYCGIYKTSKSPLIKWASKQNPFKVLPDEIFHYLIVTVNEVIEVLSFDDPVIERM